MWIKLIFTHGISRILLSTKFCLSISLIASPQIILLVKSFGNFIVFISPIWENFSNGPTGNRTRTSSMPWMRNSHFTIGPYWFLWTRLCYRAHKDIEFQGCRECLWEEVLQTTPFVRFARNATMLLLSNKATRARSPSRQETKAPTRRIRQTALANC